MPPGSPPGTVPGPGEPGYDASNPFRPGAISVDASNINPNSPPNGHPKVPGKENGSNPEGVSLGEDKELNPTGPGTRPKPMKPLEILPANTAMAPNGVIVRDLGY